MSNWMGGGGRARLVQGDMVPHLSATLRDSKGRSLVLEDCYGLNVMCPPNSYAENLVPPVMVSGGGAFRRCLGHKHGALMMSLVPSLKGLH